jgi:hypothetical protein
MSATIKPRNASKNTHIIPALFQENSIIHPLILKKTVSFTPNHFTKKLGTNLRAVLFCPVLILVVNCSFVAIK